MKKLLTLAALILSVALPALAVAEEAAPTPAPVPAEEIMAYSQVYEPETSFVLSSTVAWNADASVLDVANADVRPATALVYVDADLRVLAPQEGRSRFQVEFTVLDEVGVLTRVTSAFASHGVSIRSVVQGVGEGGLARLTATTHEACQADLEATLAELSSAPFVAEVHHVNRVEES